MKTVRRVASDDLRADEVAALRDLFDVAWRNKDSEFSEEDLRHAFGGVHFIVKQEGRIVSHGSVIARELHTVDHRLTTGYVEAVATLSSRQGRGHGSTVMRAIGEHIDRTFQLGALDTGIPGGRKRPRSPDADHSRHRSDRTTQLRVACRRRLVRRRSSWPTAARSPSTLATPYRRCRRDCEPYHDRR